MKFKLGDKVYIPEYNRVETVSIVLNSSMIFVGEHSLDNPLYGVYFIEDELIPISQYRTQKIKELLD